MKLLNSFFIFVISFQVAFANDAVVKHFNSSLKKMSRELRQDLDQFIVNETNKLLANPHELKNRINKRTGISKKDRQLFNENFDKVDKKLLSQVKVTLENGKHIIALAPGKRVVLDVGTLPKGYIIINGQKLSMQEKNFFDFQKIHKILQQKNLTQKTSLYNIVIPSAYAILPILQFALGAIAVFASSEAALTFMENLFSSENLFSRNVRKNDKIISRFEKGFLRAHWKCQTDRTYIEQFGGNQSEVLDQATLVFIKEIENFSNKKLKPYHKRHSDDFLSCENIKGNQGITVKTYLTKIELFRRVGNMCIIAKELQKCLNEVKGLMEKHNRSISDLPRSSRKPNDYYRDYDFLLDNFSGTKSVIE